MISDYWNTNWNRAAGENNDIRFISGWGNRTFQDMLFCINDTADKLDLQTHDRLLDVGCGAGLFGIAFNRWVREIWGIDYASEMVAVAKSNTAAYKNVHTLAGDIRALPFKSSSFDKTLVNSVLQYLDDINEVKSALEEVIRVTKNGGLILLSLIPDAKQKKNYLKGYQHRGLTAKEIKKKIEDNNTILWLEEDNLISMVSEIDTLSCQSAAPLHQFHRRYYYDLIIKK